MANTADERETIRRLRQLHGVQPKDMYHLFPHIPKRTLRRISNEPTKSVIPPEAPQAHDLPATRSSQTHTNDGITIEHKETLVGRVTTLQDLIDVAEIDLERWKIDRWVANTWENAMKDNNGQPIITTLYQIKANLINNPLKLSKMCLEDMRKEIRAAAPQPTKKRYPATNNGNMLEISIPDMHFGKIAHYKETGNEWDIVIARETYNAALNALVTKAIRDKPELILFPLGNDLLNIDTPQGTTTKGTPQDNTTSLLLLFKQVKDILKQAIINLREIAPVKVICVPGNHDRTMSYLIVDALEDIFHHDPHVTVENNLKPRSYISWGNNLLGFTHGDEERHTSLPGIMAHEAKQKWAKAHWHEWHIGHMHKPKEQHYLPTVTHDGVIIRTIPSLTAADTWHVRKGFTTGTRSAEAYIWNKDAGMTALYRANLKANGEVK